VGGLKISFETTVNNRKEQMWWRLQGYGEVANLISVLHMHGQYYLKGTISDPACLLNPLACVLNTTVVGPPAVVFFHCPFKFCTKLYYNS
jgi:hypothetical protein